ncbi:MAG: class I SAM-dependent methyltransferase [Candidatus Thorarchaeota archaeon]
MKEYYSARLSAERLKRCYDIAPPRIRQYLDAEIQYVLGYVEPHYSVLELGCGYGRVLSELIPYSEHVVGIDTSLESLKMAKLLLRSKHNCDLFEMNAAMLGLRENRFDIVVCIQNGISAFKVDPHTLVNESLRVTSPGGICLFSSYSDKFWEDRLEWFRLQSTYGLLGKIDWEATCNGVIACEDGFRATTYDPSRFEALTLQMGIESRIIEVDNSSVFCVINKQS